MIAEQPIIKKCKKCKQNFITWFPFRCVCNVCILKILKINRDVIDASTLTLWREN